MKKEFIGLQDREGKQFKIVAEETPCGFVNLVIKPNSTVNLIEEAKRKGYVLGVKIHPVDHPNWIQTIAASIYDIGNALHCVAPEREWRDGCSNPCIYRDGKWAEIISDKKKLPKTKEEFEEFLVIFENGHYTYTNFLNEYEF